MDFFEQQEAARRTSRRLVAWFVLAVLLVAASYIAAAALIYALWAKYWGAPALMPVPLALAVAAIVGGSILAVCAWRMWQLSEGGPAVAELLGARYVESGRCTPTERRLLNVVEEMAIASGVSVPPVYCLEREQAINALVAGHSPNEAVIVVTRGALTRLSRDELQGVMGHEFSHILNGDMSLNVRLVGLLAGLTWIADAAEALFFDAMWEARSKPREQRGGEAFAAVWAALIALIGFPGTLAADAIKAAVSRQRELLADSASVQFTRNPEGIAGALDSILALRAHTVLLSPHREMFSHMFFAPALARWWGFPTHPPILERIRRVLPRFSREAYRERRHGMRQEVAVIDGGGNVVKHVKSLQTVAGIVASIGHPSGRHVDQAARLLAALPAGLREALRSAPGAEQAMLDLAREERLEGVERGQMLALAELAVPAIKEQPQKARDAFLGKLDALVRADARLTLREFVLVTFLRQRLREGAGAPIRTRFRKLDEVAGDARAVLSLVALAAREGAHGAFERGAAVLRYGWSAPLGREALTFGGVSEALERLRHLAPFEKPALLKACLEAAAADGMFRLAEVELVRMVAATLDCPVPPLLERVSVSS